MGQCLAFHEIILRLIAGFTFFDMQHRYIGILDRRPRLPRKAFRNDVGGNCAHQSRAPPFCNSW
jgi:hypothetical protein